jgi:hypothetical protein
MKKGSKHSMESIEKIRQARKGHGGRKGENNSMWGRKGERSPNWKGDAVGYSGLHMWMVATFGQPTECDHCGTTEAKRYDWANISKTYKRDRSDWLRLCASCHFKYDDIGTKTFAKRWVTRRLKGI